MSQHVAEVKNINSISEIHYNRHIMLDHHDRNPLLLSNIDKKPGEILFFLAIHAGHRLIDQKNLRQVCTAPPI